MLKRSAGMAYGMVHASLTMISHEGKRQVIDLPYLVTGRRLRVKETQVQFRVTEV